MKPESTLNLLLNCPTNGYHLSCPEQKALFSFEMVNGRDVKRVLAQIEKHIVALRDGAMAAKYEVPRNYSALHVFARKRVLERVLGELPTLGPATSLRYLLFAQLQGTLSHALECWRPADRPDRVTHLIDRRWREGCGVDTANLGRTC